MARIPASSPQRPAPRRRRARRKWWDPRPKGRRRQAKRAVRGNDFVLAGRRGAGPLCDDAGMHAHSIRATILRVAHASTRTQRSDVCAGASARPACKRGAAGWRRASRDAKAARLARPRDASRWLLAAPRQRVCADAGRPRLNTRSAEGSRRR